MKYLNKDLYELIFNDQAAKARIKLKEIEKEVKAHNFRLKNKLK